MHHNVRIWPVFLLLCLIDSAVVAVILFLWNVTVIISKVYEQESLLVAHSCCHSTVLFDFNLGNAGHWLLKQTIAKPKLCFWAFFSNRCNELDCSAIMEHSRKDDFLSDAHMITLAAP